MAPDAPVAAALQLVIRGTGRVVPLAPGATLTLGRVPQCDLQIDDESVTRRHCTLAVTAGAGACDASADERFAGGQSVIRQSVRSVMCVPLRTTDEILGALYVDSVSAAGRFSEADLELLAAIGNIQSPAIKTVLPGVRSHHEKWDGTGYPDRLAGEDIPFLGRLLGIADVFDALTSERAYRGAMPADFAVNIIRDGSGTHFEPRLAELVIERHERGVLLPPGWES
jgi:hypothetical protein